MITDILARLAVLDRQIPDDEFDLDTAAETAIDGLERDVTDAEREELDRVLPEWFEGGMNDDVDGYCHVSVVRLTMDDPRNGHEEGSVFIEPGTCDDGVAYTVIDGENEGFLDIECEVLETFEADSPMSRSDIKDWGAQQAKQAGIPE